MNSDKIISRLADEDDIEDILDFVNTSYSVESDEKNPFCFRKKVQKLSLDEVLEGEIEAMNINWLLLEASDALIACTRIKIEESIANNTNDTLSKSAKVDILAILGENETFNFILKSLVSKVEHTCHNLDISKIIVEVPEWRSDVTFILEQMNYKDLSGHDWPDSKKNELLKPTMVLEYHKILNENNSLAQTIEQSLDHLSIGELNNDLDPTMENLMKDLFSALHKDYPEHKV